MSKCPICDSTAKRCFDKQILAKYNVNYWECPNCKFVFTDPPFWLEEAYQNTITLSDSGVLSRAICRRYYTSALLFLVYGKKAKCLDYGGAYGLFVRAMRDLSVEFYWYDKYTENLLAKDFDHAESGHATYDLLTSFEVFEHLPNPVEEIENMLQFSRKLFFTTCLIPTPSPPEWSYYATEHGQHISFYRKETFEFIARKYSLNFYSNGMDLHLLTEKNLSWFSQKILFNAIFVRIIYVLFFRLFSNR